MPDTPTTHAIFILVRTTPEWLALAPKERFAFLDSDIRPILRAHAAVRLRFFDAEAFNARVTDVMMWETEDLAAYSSLVESLRETRFWGRYFEVTEILPSVENAYARHYGVAPVITAPEGTA